MSRMSIWHMFSYTFGGYTRRDIKESITGTYGRLKGAAKGLARREQFSGAYPNRTLDGIVFGEQTLDDFFLNGPDYFKKTVEVWKQRAMPLADEQAVGNLAQYIHELERTARAPEPLQVSSPIEWMHELSGKHPDYDTLARYGSNLQVAQTAEDFHYNLARCLSIASRLLATPGNFSEELRKTQAYLDELGSAVLRK